MIFGSDSCLPAGKAGRRAAAGAVGAGAAVGGALAIGGGPSGAAETAKPDIWSNAAGSRGGNPDGDKTLGCAEGCVLGGLATGGAGGDFTGAVATSGAAFGVGAVFTTGALGARASLREAEAAAMEFAASVARFASVRRAALTTRPICNTARIARVPCAIWGAKPRDAVTDG